MHQVMCCIANPVNDRSVNERHGLEPTSGTQHADVADEKTNSSKLKWEKNDVIINVACTLNVWFNCLTATLFMKARSFHHHQIFWVGVVLRLNLSFLPPLRF